MSKITPTIYKLDLDKITSKASRLNVGDKKLLDTKGLIKANNVHDIIKKSQDDNREKGLTSAKPFELLNNGVQKVADATVAIYGIKNSSKDHEWQNLFPDPIGELKVKRQNLAAFIVIGDSCYAISAGSGYTFFEQFIDTSFPIDIARRIMSPELDATAERAITGAIYGRVQQFRTSQLIASSQNLGVVWQGFRGKVNDITQTSDRFSDFFDTYASKTGVEAGSSLKIRRSISIKKLIDLIIWLAEQLDIEPSKEQNDAFRFLDTLEEVSSRKEKALISELKGALAQALLEKLQKGESVTGFDFCHRYMDMYLSADTYHFSAKEIDESSSFEKGLPPQAGDVLDDVYKYFMPSSKDEIVQLLDEIIFEATHNSDERDSTKSSLLNHLHGEVQYMGECYFLIDQKWYKASNSFVNRVKDDFEKLLEGEFMTDTGLALDPYTQSKEGDYNESYISRDDWLVADRVFQSNIEIADLIHFTHEGIFIVHNKIGFDVKIRDVCSQILHSMSIIAQAKASSDRDLLGGYYDSIIAKFYTLKAPNINKDTFIDRILTTSSEDITYVLGYINSKPVSATSRSNIAKFETVKLCLADRRAFDFKLKIVHITGKSV